MEKLGGKQSYLIAIDSDGCALDVMEAKHQHCFTPTTIGTWGLEAVAGPVREVTERINLYSDQRGLNRFSALVLTFDLLRSHEAIRRAGIKLPEMESLRSLVEGGVTALPSIREEAEKTGASELQAVVRWSEAINQGVANSIEPRLFEGVAEFISQAQEQGKVAVVSSAATETLKREWKHCGLADQVDAIYGQEHGSKAQILGELQSSGYSCEACLMIGDAPGDERAADACGFSFYPIIPREESLSWRELNERHWPAFVEGRYRQEDEPGLRSRFRSALPPLNR